MLENDTVKIENYFKDFLQGAVEWRVLKILLFGNGCIGKTTLLTALEHIEQVSRSPECC